MKQKIVGTYAAGYRYIELVAMEGSGGQFWVTPGDIKYPRIKVGMNHDRWWEVASVLFHEVFELCAGQAKCTFRTEEDLGRDAREGFIVMRHDQMSDVVARCADFMANSMPDLKKAWIAWNRKPRKKKRKKKRS